MDGPSAWNAILDYQRVRLALGGVNMLPVRLTAVERQLEGQPISSEGSTLDIQRLANTLQTGMTGFQPPSDVRATGGIDGLLE